MMNMLIKSGILLGGLAVSLITIEKLEKITLKRNTVSVKVTPNEKGEVTKEQLKEAFEKAHKMADEMEM